MDAIAVCERYYAALRDRDLKGAIATLALDCQAEAPGASLENRDAIEAWIGGFFSAFPDISHETQKLELAGETVLVDLHLHGTHTRPLMTPQGATRRPIAASRSTPRTSCRFVAARSQICTSLSMRRTS